MHSRQVLYQLSYITQPARGACCGLFTCGLSDAEISSVFNGEQCCSLPSACPASAEILVISAFMQHDCTDGAHVQTAPESQEYTHLTGMHGSFNILKNMLVILLRVFETLFIGITGL